MARAKDADAPATRAAILRAAHEVLEELDSPTKVSLRQVALRAEVSLGTLQYHFKNKEALLEACLDGYHERLGALAQRFIMAANDPTADRQTFIADATRTIYRFIREERAAVKLRLVTTTAKGELSPTRQPEFMGTLLAAAAASIAPFTTVAPLDVRLSIQAMATMVPRYALLSDGELTNITGLPIEEARGVVEDYVVRAACRLVGAPEPVS